MEESVVKKGERAFDDFVELFQRRKLASLVVVLILLLPAMGFAIANFWGKGALREEIRGLRRERDDLKTDRDAKASQLAPFLAIANQRFEAAPPDKRLDLLLARLEELKQTVKETAALLPRSPKLLNNDQITHLQSALDFLKIGKVHIASVNGDNNAFDLAQQLAGLFQNSGFSLTGVDSVVSSVPLKGLKITIKDNSNPQLTSVLEELCRDLDQQPVITINMAIENDIDFLVGAR